MVDFGESMTFYTREKFLDTNSGAYSPYSLSLQSPKVLAITSC